MLKKSGVMIKIALLIIITLTSCGKKGDLYLDDNDADEIIQITKKEYISSNEFFKYKKQSFCEDIKVVDICKGSNTFLSLLHWFINK